MKQGAIDDFVTQFRMKLEREGRKLMYANLAYYEYSGGAWQIMTPEEIEALEPMMHELATETEFPYAKEHSKIHRTMKSMFGPKKVVLFDKEPMLVTPKGTYFVEKDKIRKHDPEHYATRRIAVDVDPSAECPLWLDMLDRMFSDYSVRDREEIKTFLQEWFGVSVVRSRAVAENRDLRKGLILFGPKRTAKTTLADVLRALLGTSRVVSPALDSLGKEFGMLPLINASGLISDDGISVGSKGDPKILKPLITGEAISVNRKFLNPIEFSFNGPVLFTTNTLPKIEDDSDATADRLLVIQMTRTFSKADVEETMGGYAKAIKYLEAKKQLPGILTWALEGYDRAITNGTLAVPGLCLDYKREFRRQADPVFDMVASCCELDLGVQTSSEALQYIASEYAQQMHGIKVTMATAQRRLPQHIIDQVPGVKMARLSHGDKRYVSTCVGLKINDFGWRYMNACIERGVPGAKEASKAINWKRSKEA